jgi:hypothetical protein
MKMKAPVVASLFSLLLAGFCCADDTETLVFIRHGEKPPDEIGQLNCQGLNRALLLPDVLTKQFGKPDFIFAPGTSDKIENRKTKITYDYVRPLITIAPTAIRYNLPINADFGFTQIDPLQAELLSAKYKTATVFIAWEHVMLQKLVTNMMAKLNPSQTVDPWPSDDFDSIFVVIVHRKADGSTAGEYSQKHENLSPEISCPTGASK